MSAGLQRFDQYARRTLTRAHEEAVRVSQPLIRPEHILLALCEDEGSTGGIFAKQGIKCEHLRRLVDELPQVSVSSEYPHGRIDLARETQQLLEMTIEIVRIRGDSFIGAGHILSALLKQNEVRVNSVLIKAGIDRNRLSEQAEEILGSSPELNELDELLDTLNTLRKYLENDLEQQKRIDTIQRILQDYFRR